MVSIYTGVSALNSAHCVFILKVLKYAEPRLQSGHDLDTVHVPTERDVIQSRTLLRTCDVGRCSVHLRMRA